MRAEAPSAANPGRVSASARLSRQSGSVGSPASAQRSWPSTLNAGRGAGRTKASEVVGLIRSGSRPLSSYAALARPNQVVEPVEVPW